MSTTDEQLDLLIIGAGPAGLSAADVAAHEGLSYLVIEKIVEGKLNSFYEQVCLMDQP